MESKANYKPNYLEAEYQFAVSSAQSSKLGKH
jgi:hypothetical protein